jgi:hypothetical protein
MPDAAISVRDSSDILGLTAKMPYSVFGVFCRAFLSGGV